MNDERRPARNAAATTTIPDDTAHSGRLLTAREVAEWFSFSPATIVDWAEKGALPHFKLGGRLRFSEPDVAAWLEEHKA